MDVGGDSPGAPGGPPAPAAPVDLRAVCRLFRFFVPHFIGVPPVDPSQFKDGDFVVQECRDAATDDLISITTFTWHGAVPPIDPAALAAHAREKLELPLPAPRAWPSLDAPQITGIETWLHVDNFTAATRTATAGGVSATVHADPVVVDWNMGDGGWVTCHDGGPVFAEGASTTCGYTFTNRSTGRGDGLFHGTVTITWHLHWDSNIGGGGDLGDVRRTTPIDWTVHELQALIN